MSGDVQKCSENNNNNNRAQRKTEQVKNIENTCSVHAERKIGSELLCRWIDDFKKPCPIKQPLPT
ncbi:MAG: hypothetical protein LBL62_09730, partial [Planctomycetaceae bacterium]|nr:hypothetical protein [Planctomycetaceae bacterium]